MKYLPSLKTIGKLAYGTTQVLAEAAQDTFVIEAVTSFLLGDEEHDKMNVSAWITLAATTVAAIPLTITILHHWFHPESQHDREDPEHQQEHQHHQHGKCHTAMELIVIGVPFGLLAFGGSYNLLSHAKNCPEWAQYLVSTILGAVNGWGNYKLHSDHIHAQQGYCDLLKELPQKKRCKAISLSTSIGVGHLFQGFLAGNLFLHGIKITNIVAKYTLPIILAILVTIFEGHTEMRSSLLQMSSSQNDQHQRLQSKLATIPASIVHGILPTTGLIQFIRFTYMQSTKQELAKHLPLYGRILIFVGSLLIIGYPNANGFYCTTLPATDKALTLFSCCTRHEGNQSGRLLEDEEESNENSTGGEIVPVVTTMAPN